MNRHKLLKDEALATFTDALLEGQIERGSALGEGESDLPPLAGTVAVLARALGDPQPPPARLRHQVRQRIRIEWARQRPSLLQRLLEPFQQPRYRRAWAAATVLALAALAVALLLPTDATRLPATATGEPGTAILAIALVLAATLLAARLISRRSR